MSGSYKLTEYSVVTGAGNLLLLQHLQTTNCNGSFPLAEVITGRYDN